MSVLRQSESIRVLTVDDHQLLREGIAAVIEGQEDMTLVAQASNGREAVESFRRLRPDVTLMDLRMPDMSGIEAITAIRAEFPDARIVVLTTYAGDAQAAAALKAGAVGYLLKNLVRKELLETIRAVHAGKRRVPPEIATEIAEHVADDALTEREDRSAAAGRGGQVEQADRRGARHLRRHRQDAHEEHPAQARRLGPHARGDDRAEARNPGPVTGQYMTVTSSEKQ